MSKRGWILFLALGLLWGMPERDPAQLRVAITCLTRGVAPGQLVYALDTEGRTAVCLFDAEDGTERRLHRRGALHVFLSSAAARR